MVPITRARREQRRLSPLPVQQREDGGMVEPRDNAGPQTSDKLAHAGKEIPKAWITNNMIRQTRRQISIR